MAKFIKKIDMVYSFCYSKVSNKRTVFNNRTGGDIILQITKSLKSARALGFSHSLGPRDSTNLAI